MKNVLDPSKLQASRLSQILELIGLLNTRAHNKQHIYRLPFRAVVVDLTKIYFLQIGTQRGTLAFHWRLLAPHASSTIRVSARILVSNTRELSVQLTNLAFRPQEQRIIFVILSYAHSHIVRRLSLVLQRPYHI